MNKILKKNKHSKALITLSAISVFALVAVFGFSILTGNTDQSNVGTSYASTTEPADINNDNTVNVFDLSILLSKWNSIDATSDLNKDGAINVYDLSMLLSKWGPVRVTTVETYPAPAGITADANYTVSVNGSSSFVYSSYFGAYTSFSFSGSPVTVAVNSATPINTAVIHPTSDSVTAVFTPGSNSLQFNISNPGDYSVEINGISLPLFVFANPVETNKPLATDTNVMYYAAGQVYDVGELLVPSGKTLYIEGGAVLRGKVRVGPGTISGTAVSNVRIAGRGIVDSTYLADPGRPLRIQKSSNVSVEGITFLGREAWGVVTYQSNLVNLTNIKVLNWRETGTGTPDGIDTVGSTNVTVADSFIRSYDDGITVKNNKNGWLGDADTVTMQNLVIWNGDAGNALEIGWENNANYIRNISYKDIDIIHKTARADTNKRAAISIHLVDGAAVSAIRYDDIRIEDAQENLMYFTLMKNGTSLSSNVGSIGDVQLKNITVSGSAVGLPIVIAGYDSSHQVGAITFTNLRYNNQLVSSETQANVTKSNAAPPVFSP